MEKIPKISIILPVANERGLIRDTLTHLVSLGADEVIVVDGSSTDGTCEIIKREFPSVRCFETAYPERSLQMNLGAFEAKSDVFLFVHADMRLPERAIELVRNKIQEGYIGGGFKKQYMPTDFRLKLYSAFLNAFYFGCLHCLVGTNAIFVTREIFEKMNGFPDITFLEDVIFSECIKKQGKIALIKEPVLVSPRRYLKHGLLKQMLKNARILLGYKFFHENPENLREIYKGGF